MFWRWALACLEKLCLAMMSRSIGKSLSMLRILLLPILSPTKDFLTQYLLIAISQRLSNPWSKAAQERMIRQRVPIGPLPVVPPPEFTSAFWFSVRHRLCSLALQSVRFLSSRTGFQPVATLCLCYFVVQFLGISLSVFSVLLFVCFVYFAVKWSSASLRLRG